MITLRRNVLIFHQAALGDFVMTWPIALACARLWPTNRILYITHAGKGALAERAIGTEYRDAETLHPLFSEDAKLSDAASKLIAGATNIISFVSDGNDSWARNIRRLAPEAPLICVNPRPAESADQHLMTFHASQFDPNPQLQAAIGQMITHVAANGATARRAPGYRIVIHPGAGSIEKCWPGERFVALSHSLKAAGQDVHIIIGEVEREKWSPGSLQAIRTAATIHEPRDLVELFTLLQSARLYIGNDSGPTHLAAISGVPTLALFGRNNEGTWRPIGPSVRLLKQVPISDLPIEAVLEATNELLASLASTTESAVAADDD